MEQTHWSTPIGANPVEPAHCSHTLWMSSEKSVTSPQLGPHLGPQLGPMIPDRPLPPLSSLPPPALVRQVALNPELVAFTGQARTERLQLVAQARHHVSRGTADSDCFHKWDLTLEDLLSSGDLDVTAPKRSNWYNDNKYRTLSDLLVYPLRFPVSLYVRSNGTLTAHQRQVIAPEPDYTAFCPVQTL